LEELSRLLANTKRREGQNKTRDFLTLDVNEDEMGVKDNLRQTEEMVERSGKKSRSARRLMRRLRLPNSLPTVV